MAGVSQFYLMHVRQAFGDLKKNGVYWVDRYNAAKLPKGVANLYPTSLLKQYSDQKNLILIRSGGIGDVIALSSLVGIAENTIMLTQEAFKPLARWFEHECIFKSFQEPMFMVKFPNTVEQEALKYGIMIGEDIIEEGSDRNWFDVFYESIGLQMQEGEGRPMLKTLTKEQNNKCLIVPTASCVNRCMDRDMIRAVAKRHFDNIVFSDEQKWSLTDYLYELDRAKFVISVDTSALHFREGVGKPALGIYGAFSADCRTRYYKYTKSIDIKSPCPIQPCYKHSDSICEIIAPGMKSAPCLSTWYNLSVAEQVDKALIDLMNSNTKLAI